MRLLSLAILGFLLAAVYWIGATVYSERIEQDITERSNAALSEYDEDIALAVDGRDVTLEGTAVSESDRDHIRSVANSVRGVRKTADLIKIQEPVETRFDFNAEYDNQKLHMAGTVDDDNTVAMINNIHKALPPTTLISTGEIGTGAAPLVRSPEKVETGIAALTQLNRGDLQITDEVFALNGVVSDEERLQAIEQLIETRRAALEPLDVRLNIDIDPYLAITQACREAMKSATHGNVLNYKVDFFNRMIFSYLDEANEKVITLSKDDFKAAYTDGTINDDTLVFDNLVKTKDQFLTEWLKPLKDSWHKRFV